MKKRAQKKTKIIKKSVKKSALTLKRIVQIFRSRVVPKLLKKLKIQKINAITPQRAMPTAATNAPSPKGFELPERYGEDNLVLLVRDPWWIYAYWEVTPEHEREVSDLVMCHGSAIQAKVLRIYDVTDKNFSKHHSFFDIEIGFSNNWYVDVGEPDRQWVAEVGFRTRDGRFFALVRSNIVRTPRFGVSDVLDEEWLLPDELYWKIFGLSGGITGQKSSLAVKEILERYLRGLGASENSPNFKPHSKTEKKDARLVLSPQALLEKS